MSIDKNQPGYVDQTFLARAAEALKQAKEDSYRFMQVKPGQRVMDVGCGPATDTINLAKIVGSGGQVIGIDHDQEMINLANQKAAAAGVSVYVQHEMLNAAQLPFDNDFFDSCRSERVFEHIKNSDPVLAEMVRVTKPGGWIVLVSGHYPISFFVDTSFVDLEWRIRRFKTDQLRNGYAAGQFYRRLREKGCEVEVHIYPVVVTEYELFRLALRSEEVENGALAEGVVTREELQQYDAELKKRDAEGTFFATFEVLMAVGRKPLSLD